MLSESHSFKVNWGRFKLYSKKNQGWKCGPVVEHLLSVCMPIAAPEQWTVIRSDLPLWQTPHGVWRFRTGLAVPPSILSRAVSRKQEAELLLWKCLLFHVVDLFIFFLHKKSYRKHYIKYLQLFLSLQIAIILASNWNSSAVCTFKRNWTNRLKEKGAILKGSSGLFAPLSGHLLRLYVPIHWLFSQQTINSSFPVRMWAWCVMTLCPA